MRAFICQEGCQAATGTAPCEGRVSPVYGSSGISLTHAGRDGQVRAAEDIGLCVQAEKEREREERVRRRVGEELRALEVKSQGKFPTKLLPTSCLFCPASLVSRRS